jgi:hypothetical protein
LIAEKKLARCKNCRYKKPVKFNWVKEGIEDIHVKDRPMNRHLYGQMAEKHKVFIYTDAAGMQPVLKLFAKKMVSHNTM